MSFSEHNPIFTVTEFIAHLNLTLSDFGLIRIQGEVSDISLKENYGFFTLKESVVGREGETAVGCFIGRNALQQVRHFLQNGIEVVISGFPKVYHKNGSLRIEVLSVEPLGEGALEKAFLALQKKLESEGYFSEDRKRPLPEFFQRIGVVTSQAGAAIVDFEKNLSPNGFFVAVVDTLVEGIHAEQGVARAIERLQSPNLRLDIIVIIRGGGSLQSLQAFNSPLVATAVYSSRLPVITGIGHERDVTIADLVADVRCSTPTAVAVFLSGQRERIRILVDEHSEVLLLKTVEFFEKAQSVINSYSEQLSTQMSRHLQDTRFQIQNISQKLEARLQNFFHRFYLLQQQLTGWVQVAVEKISQKKALAISLEKRLHELDPKSILKRGYSIVYDSRGKVVTRVEQTRSGDTIKTELAQGTIQSNVI